MIRNLLAHLVDHIGRRLAAVDTRWASKYAEMGMRDE